MPATQTAPEPLRTVHACGRTWQLVTTTRKAHTLRIDPATGLSSYGGWSATVDLPADDGTTVAWVYTWPCPCGVDVELALPAYDWTDCRACDLAARDRNHPDDYYSRPRGSCSCCGPSGRHVVYRDKTRPRPTCLTV